MSLRKYLILITVFYFSLNSFAVSQEQVFQRGEELQYIVSYGFIDLGEVTIRTDEVRTIGNTLFIKASCVMKTYSGIPLVELDSRFESDMIYAEGILYSTEFRAWDKKSDGTVEIRYKFNYDSGFVSVLKKNKGKTEIDGNISTERNVRFQDGLSLFFQARTNSYRTQSYMIPVFMNESESSVKYFISSENERVELERLGKKPELIKCSGEANFVGVLGLTGEFAGWFTTDPARVPVLAKMNVLLGSITLESKVIKRLNWELK